MNDKFFLIIFVLFLYFYQRRRQSLQYIYEFNNGMLYLRGKSKIYEIMSKKKISKILSILHLWIKRFECLLYNYRLDKKK